MRETLIKIDLSSAPGTQDVLHNRWDPDIPMVATVKPGAEFRVECVDWTGGQIRNHESANDVRDVNLTKVHYLSGPIEVDGAEPGDLLVVDILDVGVLPESDWGFTGIFARSHLTNRTTAYDLLRFKEPHTVHRSGSGIKFGKSHSGDFDAGSPKNTGSRRNWTPI
jgi:acetamidase/formamidase